MFRTQAEPIPILRLIAACVGIPIFVIAVYAQQENASLSKLSDTLQLMSVAVVVVSGLAGTVYGVLNRKKYGSLLAIIAEKDMTIESKAQRIENVKATSAENEEKLRLIITALELENKKLEVNNEAMVSQNLQMKAKFKELRKHEKWDRSDDDLFRTP